MIERIRITEEDSTGVIQNQDIFNAVLVPGFVGKSAEDVSLCPLGVPIVCNKLDTFKNIFGNEPAYFKADQPYPRVSVEETSTFELNETPSSNTITSSISGTYIYPNTSNAFDGVITFSRNSTAYVQNGISLSDIDVSAANINNYYFKNVKLHEEPYTKCTIAINNGNLIVYNDGDELATGTEIDIDIELYVYIKNITTEPATGNSIFFVKNSQTGAYTTELDSNTGLSSGMSLEYKTSLSNAGFDNLSIPNSGKMFSEGDPDPSYIYATELLSRGMTVAYVRLNEWNGTEYDEDNVTVNNFYVQLNTLFSAQQTAPLTSVLLDTNEYSGLKYLTSGGYPTLGWNDGNGTSGEAVAMSTISDKMLAVAQARGDCIALLDHTNNPERDLHGSNSVYAQLLGDDNDPSGYPYYALDSDRAKYGVVYTPWAAYSLKESYQITRDSGTVDTVSTQFKLPASFYYLCCVSNAIRSNNPWLSIAGISRGLNNNIVKLNTDKILTSSIADYYQTAYSSEKGSMSINAITNINPYGLVIWGNRTLNRNSGVTLSASSFVNIRSIMCDIKKYLMRYAKEFMFEQNTDIIFSKFSGKVASVLDNMQTSTVIAGYVMRREPSDDPTKIKCVLTIYPTYSIESFDISINISNREVIVD